MATVESVISDITGAYATIVDFRHFGHFSTLVRLMHSSSSSSFRVIPDESFDV